VVTDVIIPDMNGRELAEALQAVRPGLPILFISGYSANVIAHHGVLDAGVHFLEKPFTYDDLLRHIRKALAPVYR
jgi:two-component system sensor histidine kinase EvgS